MSHIIVDNNHF